MAGCRILPQPAMCQLIESRRIKGSLRRAYARSCPATRPLGIQKRRIYQHRGTTKRKETSNEVKRDQCFWHPLLRWKNVPPRFIAI
jgi:hypothetical protein